MNATAARRLDALTGARFFAAFHVLLFHYGGPLLAAAPRWADRVRDCGYVAVSFFFVLSGFVIAYHHAADAERRALDVRAFWVSRLSRIYPLHAVGLLVMVPLAIRDEWNARVFGSASLLAKGVTLAAHASFTQGWVPQLAMSWNLPAWSVCAEAFFYAAFPLLAVQLARVRSQRQLFAAMAALWFVSLAIAAAYLMVRPDGAGPLARHTSGRWLEALKYNPLVRLPEFAFGVCLGKLFRLGDGARGGGGILAVLATIGIVAALAASSWLPYPLLHNGLLLPLFGALVFGLAKGGGALGRVLAARPLVLLGDASYALYILQFPLMLWATVLAGAGVNLDGAPFRAAYLLAAVALSVAAHLALERPIQRRLRPWLLAQVRRGTPRPASGTPLPAIPRA